ncbi:MAG: ATP-sensitive inward rectifier potassium channel 10, partial [Myxococcota bacterium]
EAMVSMLFTAMATGLLFAKFAMPTSRVRFSRTAVIGNHNGERTLIFRMANERSNQIVEANINVVIIRSEQTLEGESLRRFYDLPLRRSQSPVFSLGWTAYHSIKEDSPLAGATAESLAAMEAVILVSLSGTDSTLWQSVYARHAYSWSEIEFDRRFVDLVQVRPDGSRMIDYSDFHMTMPDEDRGADVASLVG